MTAPVLVTRPETRIDGLCGRLAQRGIDTLHVPTVAIDMASRAEGLDAALAELSGTDWLVVTSAHGAHAVAARLEATGQRLPPSLRVAAVGPETAAALREAGLPVAHVPQSYRTVAIADGLGDVARRRVVLARADAASSELPRLLRRRGAFVTEVEAYRTVEGPAAGRDPLRQALRAGLAGVAFTSGSTVHGLMRLAPPVDRARWRTLSAFCIGPVTASAARRSGFHVAVESREHTGRALADAIADHLERESP